MSHPEELSVFQVLDQLNKKNHSVYQALTSSEQKKFSPFVLLKWMYYSKVDPIKLQSINCNFFHSQNNLQMSLLSVPTNAKNIRWKWVKSQNKNQKKDQGIQAIMDHYGVTNSTALSVYDMMSTSEIEELVSAANN